MSSPASNPDNQPRIDLNEILAEMDELGRAKFDAALERVKVRKLEERIAELENQRQASGSAGD